MDVTKVGSGVEAQKQNQMAFSGEQDGMALSEPISVMENDGENNLEISNFGNFNMEGKIFPRKVGKETFLIAIFQNAESLFIRGAVDCRLVYGWATCFGFPLDQQYRPIVSAVGSGMLSIQTLSETLISPISAWYADRSNQKSSQWTKEDTDIRLDQLIGHLVKNGSQEMLNSIRAVVVFKKSNFIDSYPLLRDATFGKGKFTSSTSCNSDIESASLVGTLEKGFKAFLVSPAWQPLVASLKTENPPREFMVCGKKHVGKSTTMRYLVNELLAKFGKVVLLDCDLGQPELTSPGFISLSVLTSPLLGPSYANIHLSQPEWQESHFVGCSSAKEKLEDILNVATMLFARYKFSMEAQFLDNTKIASGDSQSNATLAPIVINTHGWVEGPGYDTLARMVYAMTPSQLIQIIPASDPVLFVPEQLSPVNVFLHLLRPVIEHTSYATIQSTEKRQLQIMSALSSPSKATYCLPWSSIRVHVLDVEVPPSQLMYVLNGSLVALMVDLTSYLTLQQAAMQQNSKHARDEENLHMDITKEGGSTTSSPSYGSMTSSDPLAVPTDYDLTLPVYVMQQPPYMSSYCVGVGLITSIDMKKRTYYLSTSVPKALLLEVNTLVKGSIEVPPAMLLASAIPATPYLTADSVSAQGTGAGNLTVRNNLVRFKPQQR